MYRTEPIITRILLFCIALDCKVPPPAAGKAFSSTYRSDNRVSFVLVGRRRMDAKCDEQFVGGPEPERYA
jgi:hypothetical protein